MHTEQACASADEACDDDEGPYDPAEHSPMYNVDMDPEDRTAVFDLAMEDDSDDGGGLLDWSILAGKLHEHFQLKGRACMRTLCLFMPLATHSMPHCMRTLRTDSILRPCSGR